VATGAIWTTAARWVERLIGVASIAALARLLSPDQFGLSASANIAVAAISVFFSFGFDWALVRSPIVSKSLYDTAWTLRLLSGIFCATLILAAAVPAAIYFRDDRVAPIMILLAGTAALGSLENPTMVEYRRALNFAPEFICRLVAKVCGAAVAISIAAHYRSYWALPLGVLASTIASVVLSFALRPFKPTFCLRERASLLGFSSWLLIGGLVSFLSSRLSDLFVGRKLGQHALGIYVASSELAQIAVSELAAPINRAVFSQYSRLIDDVPALRAGYIQTSGMIWMIAIPLAAGLGMVAPYAVALLFGPLWLDAVPIIQILCAASALTLMAENTHYVLMAINRPHLVTIIEVLRVSAVLLALLILVPAYGLRGAALAQLVCALLSLPVFLVVTARTIYMRPMQFLHNTWRTVFAVALMVAVLYVLIPRSLTSTEPLACALALGAFGAIGMGTYVACLLALWYCSGKPLGPERTIIDFISARLVPQRQPIN
jgi:lipopolysaccharide exporter